MAIVVVVGASYASAGWNNPTGTPPNNNVAAPINEGKAENGTLYPDQTKYNGLTVQGVLSSSNFLATNAFKFSPTTDPNGGGSRTNKVLTALDDQGTVGWVAAAGQNAVTKIIAGANITVSPTTGVGEVTVSASSGLLPATTPTGIMTGGTTKIFGTGWHVVQLSGQQNSGTSGSGTDAGPAGAYITKDASGKITAVIFVGQSYIKECATRTIINSSYSCTLGDGGVNNIKIDVGTDDSMSVTIGSNLQLTWLVLN